MRYADDYFRCRRIFLFAADASRHFAADTTMLRFDDADACRLCHCCRHADAYAPCLLLLMPLAPHAIFAAAPFSLCLLRRHDEAYTFHAMPDGAMPLMPYATPCRYATLPLPPLDCHYYQILRCRLLPAA